MCQVLALSPAVSGIKWISFKTNSQPTANNTWKELNGTDWRHLKGVSEGFGVKSWIHRRSTVEIGAVSNATYWLNPRGKSWILCFSWHPLTHPDVWLSLPRCCSPLVSQTDTHTPLSISLHHPISLSRASLGPSGLYIRPHLHPPCPPSLSLCLVCNFAFFPRSLLSHSFDFSVSAAALIIKGSQGRSLLHWFVNNLGVWDRIS